MKFLVDENLPPRLAQWLGESGHDAVHVQDRSLLGQADVDLQRIAMLEDRILITKDSDFDDAPPPLKVLRLDIGNASTVVLLAWFGANLERALEEFDAGGRVVRLT